MSTVKISELPNLPAISANTSNTLFLGVDIPTSVTGKFTATTLAKQLFANNTLAVGNNLIVFSNTIAQFSGNDASFLQVNLQNFDANGSGDYVITADTGTNSTKYIDLGYNNSNYDGGTTFSSLKALDGYLYVHGTSDVSNDGNLIIGTASAGANVYVIAGGTANSNVVAAFHKTGLSIVGATNGLTFGDYTVQTTAAASLAYSQAAFLKANTPSHVANSAAIYANGAFLQANTPSHVANSAAVYANGAFVQANAAFIMANTPSHVANSASLYANGAFDQANAAFTKANNALANTTGTLAGSLTVTGTIATGNVTINNGVVLNDAGLFQYTTANNTTATQLSTKNNPVTCNGRTGQITTHNASLAAGRSDTFRVNNSQVATVNDIIIVGIVSGATGNTYQVGVTGVGVGYFDITISNISSAAAADTLVISYAILRVQ